MDAAFDHLRRYARNRDLRLSELAAAVVRGAVTAEVLAAPAIQPMTSNVTSTGARSTRCGDLQPARC